MIQYSVTGWPNDDKNLKLVSILLVEDVVKELGVVEEEEQLVLAHLHCDDDDDDCRVDDNDVVEGDNSKNNSNQMNVTGMTVLLTKWQQKNNDTKNKQKLNDTKTSKN